MKKYYLGIDVSKGYADFIMLDANKKCVLENFQLDDTFEGRYDHRPVESVAKTVPIRNLLLLSKKLSLLPARTRTQGSGPQRHVLHRRGLGRRKRQLASRTG